MSDIYLIGDIDEKTYKRFLYKLRILKQEKVDKINIYITTDGGDVHFAAGMFDEIEGAKKSGITINTIALGAVASAGIFILSAGDIRWGTENTTYFVHPFSYATQDYHQQTKQYVNFADEYYNNLMVSLATRCGYNTPKKIKEFLRKVNENIWLDTDSAIKFGLIDKKWNYNSDYS